MRDNDPEGLDLITLVAFEHFAGDCQTPAIIEMREEVVDLVRTRLANGEASTVPTHTSSFSSIIIDSRALTP